MPGAYKLKKKFIIKDKVVIIQYFKGWDKAVHNEIKHNNNRLS